MCQCDGGYPNRLPVIRHAQVPWDAMIYVYIHFNVKFYYATVFLVTQDVLYMCVCVCHWDGPPLDIRHVRVRNRYTFIQIEPIVPCLLLGKFDHLF